MKEQIALAENVAKRLAAGLAQVIKGKDVFIENLLICFLAGGHLLIEDFPGVGKTTAAKTLVKLIEGAHGKRIQCTPDLLPYDITGVDVYEPGPPPRYRFEAGPVFTDILLADEINRATPKTQSALLEAMAEGQVTVGGKSYALPDLFFVVATQNPPNHLAGSYPLPAPEMDRFFFRLSPGYPKRDDEYALVRESPSDTVLPGLLPVASKQEIRAARSVVSSIRCDDALIKFAVDTAHATRNHDLLSMGVSPRGPLALVKACRARAIMHGRDYATDEDFLALTPLCYNHRVMAKDSRVDPERVVSDIIKEATPLFYA